MNIEFIASKDKNSVSATTAVEAARLFLEQFKNRSFGISEYRDGRHFFEFGGDGSPQSNCFRIRFKTRGEAAQFIAKHESASKAA